MKFGRLLAGLIVCIAAAGLVGPQPLLAGGLARQETMVADVGLRDGGVLLGQVVDTSGIPKPRVEVAIADQQRPLAVGRTDERGYFAFRGLHGGVYQIAAADGCGAYRLWAPGTAPPTAQPGALVVAGQDLSRGNVCDDTLGWLGFCVCSKPLVVGALVATAVAVPVAIHNAQRHAPASP